MEDNIWTNMGVNTGNDDDFMLKTDTIQITPELLVLIAEVDEFKGAWLALGTLAPERLRALRHVPAMRAATHSKSISNDWGNKPTLSATAPAKRPGMPYLD